MRQGRTRSSDSTFELNLAPFLDIIVSIIPMLLLSVAFVHVKMIEAPTPQVVEQKPNQKPVDPTTQVALYVSLKSGFIFEITDPKGKANKVRIPVGTDSKLDYAKLYSAALEVKRANPTISSLQLYPESDVTFDELVKVMDTVREKAVERKQASLADVASGEGKTREVEYIFPEIIFASVGG